jgi:hypothetical protein
MSDMVLAWLVQGTTTSLREVIESGPPGFLRDDGPRIEELVKSRLDDVIAGRRRPYSKLGDLWEDIEREVKEALHHLCITRGIFDGDQLKTVFKDQDLKNIRSGLSKCRVPNEEKP